MSGKVREFDHDWRVASLKKKANMLASVTFNIVFYGFSITCIFSYLFTVSHCCFITEKNKNWLQHACS